MTDAYGRKPQAPKPLDIPKGSKNSPPIRGMRPRNELKYDMKKEGYREYRRVVYDFDYWANTRSTSRHFFHLLSMPTSRILQDIAPATIFVTAIAAAIAADLPQAAVAALNISIPEWTKVCPPSLPFNSCH
jgi:hypothetical protein